MKPMSVGENPSEVARKAMSVPCSPLPASRMAAANSNGTSGPMEIMV